MSKPFVPLAVLVVLLGSSFARAQPLSDYEGGYLTAQGDTLWLVGHESTLYALIGPGRYPLRRDTGDAFVNGAGSAVTFERVEAAVAAVSDGQGRYVRFGADVPARLRAGFHARAEGSPPYAYRAPDPLGEAFAVGHAAEAGLPPAVLEGLVRAVESDPDYDQVHAVLVLRGGRLVFEEYFFGHDAGRAHDLRSATKSVHAALAGVAVRQGLLALDTPVLRVLAGHLGVAITPHKASLTLADLLDMRHGLQCDDWDEASPGNERRIYEADDWIGAFLAVPDAGPDGPEAAYCSAAALAVGRAIEVRSGRALPDYAQEHLFGPLGIRREDWRWDFDLVNKGGERFAALHMRPRDLVRFGRLYLHDGTVDGRRLLPEGWTARTFDAAMPLGDWRRYSRFWWTYEQPVVVGDAQQAYPFHMASGNGGQRVYVQPDLDLVVVMTGGQYNEDEAATEIARQIVRALLEREG